VQLNPEDSMAEANLGAALAEIGELASAKTHWERALKLDLQNQLAQDDLQEVQRRLSAPSKTINQEMTPIDLECGDQPPLLSLHPQVSFYARSRTCACKTNHHPACPERFSTKGAKRGISRPPR
jgi:hypothetical protein